MRVTTIFIVHLHQCAVKQLEFLVNAPSASVVCGEYCGLQHLHNYEYCGLSRLHNRSNLWSELEKSVASLLQYFIADIITFLCHSYCMRRTFCLGKLLRSSAQIICSRAISSLWLSFCFVTKLQPSSWKVCRLSSWLARPTLKPHITCFEKGKSPLSSRHHYCQQ